MQEPCIAVWLCVLPLLPHLSLNLGSPSYLMSYFNFVPEGKHHLSVYILMQDTA